MTELRNGQRILHEALAALTVEVTKLTVQVEMMGKDVSARAGQTVDLAKLEVSFGNLERLTVARIGMIKWLISFLVALQLLTLTTVLQHFVRQ